MIKYSPARAWHPDWAWPKLEGFRREFAIENFEFTVPGNGTLIEQLPWTFKTDAPFEIRALFVPQIAILPADLAGGAYTPGNVGLVRIYTSTGQQLSSPLMLTAGHWGSGGFAGVQGYGASLVEPLTIPPGGVVSIDAQLSTNATIAAAALTFGASVLNVGANILGLAGNGRTITLLNPGAPNVALSAAAVGNNVQVTLGTNGASAIISTVAEVAAIINLTASTAALMLAGYSGFGLDVVTAVAATPLAGAVASSNILFAGSFIGYKVFPIC